MVVQDRDSTMAGLLLAPYLLGFIIVSLVYPLILRLSTTTLSTLGPGNRNGKRLIIISGAVLFLTGNVVISFFVDKLSMAILIATLSVFGAGSGLVLQTSFLQAQTAVSSDGKLALRQPPNRFHIFSISFMRRGTCPLQNYITCRRATILIHAAGLGGVIGLTISGTIQRSSVTDRTSAIPFNLVVSAFIPTYTDTSDPKMQVPSFYERNPTETILDFRAVE